MRHAKFKHVRHVQIINLARRAIRDDVADMRSIFLLEIDLWISSAKASALRTVCTYPTWPVAPDDFLGLVLGPHALLEYDIPGYHSILLFNDIAALNDRDELLGKTYLAL
jgi:hypothetical protein